jgi:glycosyltransferase involved in cell wall biosynthesis
VNVVIIGTFWFPSGTASAARVRNLALGLKECGARVHVITLAPQPRLPDRVGSDTGEHLGITYECAAPTGAAVAGWRDAGGTVPRLRRRLTDKVRWFAGLYAAAPLAWGRLRRRIDQAGCDLVLDYERSALRMTPVARLCRARRVTSLLDVVEISEHLGSRWSPLYWDSVVGTRMAPRLFDGLTVISTGLETRYRSAAGPRTLLLPALEAWPPAPPPPPTGNRTFRLTYVGALEARDAPELLFESLRFLAHRSVPVTLDVVGHYDGTPRGTRFRALAAEDPVLGGATRFLGSVSDADLAARLAASDGLVLTRRDAPTERLSFPTRLVEFLRHGRPVFVSDVGDVSRYLRHGREVVLLHPQDPQRIAEAIARVAARSDRGAEIGRRGREAGARAFDRRAHAARVLEFAAQLREAAAS